MSDQPLNDSQRAEALGAYLKSLRTGLELSLRQVEEISDNQVSNAYLSQLENGKIAKPSPHILHSLASAYNVPYERLMERAGYIPALSSVATRAARQGDPATLARVAKHGRAATHSIEHLTAEEETALLTYLNVWRGMQKREKGR
ncbi:MAG: helix-turn-helix transcriptional regulator [Opitutaceae bacterium]|nr:helix-turn-helix transcriptional regulator [Opitutaceae bacterium]